MLGSVCSICLVQVVVWLGSFRFASFSSRRSIWFSLLFGSVCLVQFVVKYKLLGSIRSVVHSVLFVRLFVGGSPC